MKEKCSFTFVQLWAAILFCTLISTAVGYRAGYLAGAAAGASARHDRRIHPLATIYDCPEGVEPYRDEFGDLHLHSPEERIGGGYRNGKFVYLKDLP